MNKDKRENSVIKFKSLNLSKLEVIFEISLTYQYSKMSYFIPESFEKSQIF